MYYLQSIGAIISMLLGIVALFYPSKTEQFVSIKSVGKEGLSEIRATYGGFFFGISVFALVAQNSLVFMALGIGWISAAIVRLVTIILGSYTSKNLAGVLFEAVIGLMCLSSYLIGS
jgi:hypothetical protein